ncbi:COP9 signalosome subunit 7 [Lindgomyces ingoldianus]|uniref:COP9 signalosome subunit 7 n=1 Tax=Lindgomyces ingoldianus TaxID=673940 RepID=A0ACB6QXM2_9PLEO|nr:COP9 signalosome subunit 7 [Lindgomyces ingoldianus]KAF2470946.1 COP9 signalosome subunit 7 [Lindgomyces ingoldianus]
MEQTRALNALEPFLALSKSANSPRAAADLVAQATAAPHTYVFAELLQTPNIQALRNSEEYASHLTLLEIFAWGSWEDYKAHGSLPKLSAQQHKKLLLLSLLPLARSHTTLTYSALMAALDLPTTRALEELITTAIYSGLLTATLDPAHSLLSVTGISPLRDLAPGSLPTLQQTLSTWSQRCESALADLEAQAASVKRAAVAREKDRRKKERALEITIAASEEKGGAKRGMSGLGEEDMMDIDQEGGSGRVLRNTKRGTGGGGFGFTRRLG